MKPSSPNSSCPPFSNRQPLDSAVHACHPSLRHLRVRMGFPSTTVILIHSVSPPNSAKASRVSRTVLNKVRQWSRGEHSSAVFFSRFSFQAFFAIFAASSSEVFFVVFLCGFSLRSLRLKAFLRDLGCEWHFHLRRPQGTRSQAIRFSAALTENYYRFPRRLPLPCATHEDE